MTRIEPRTGSVVPPIRVGNGPSALAVGEGAVWVVNRHDGTLSRIDPATNAVTWTVARRQRPDRGRRRRGRGLGGAAARRAPSPTSTRTGRASSRGGRPAAARRRSRSPAARCGPPRTPRRPRIAAARCACSSRTTRARVPMDWLHPEAYTTWASSQLGSLAYDGLVAYRRVEGAAGATLVGALATTAPAPSPDGRTYVFTLRPRTALLRRDAGPAGGLPGLDGALPAGHARPPRRPAVPADFYAGIVGARRCMAGTTPLRPRRAGSRPMRRARTVTVHLTRPDADFLHKLTMPFAFVVPADSARRATTGRTPPGTGPYRVAAWDATRGGTLVRNPHFRSDPGALAGRRLRGPDRRPPSAARRRPKRRSPRSSAAPPTWPSSPTRSAASLTAESHRGRWRAQLAGPAAQRPAPITDWMFLNVRRRPFDDIRVRQAINFAIDRRGWSSSRGARRSATSTCQILPLAFPGYAPYCPYTAGRRPAAAGPRRTWSARAGSWRRPGGPASASSSHVPEYAPRLGRYFARLLDELGFRATLRVSSGWNEDDDLRARHAGADGPAPVGRRLPRAVELHPDRNFGCARRRLGRTSRGSAIARWSARSSARSRAADGRGRRWAAADRRVVDLAAGGAADQPPLRGARVRSGWATSGPTAQLLHAARPDVGALSLESFQNWNR